MKVMVTGRMSVINVAQEDRPKSQNSKDNPPNLIMVKDKQIESVGFVVKIIMFHIIAGMAIKLPATAANNLVISLNTVLARAVARMSVPLLIPVPAQVQKHVRT